MEIVILDELSATVFVKKATVPCVMVSIVGTRQEPVAFATNPYVREILRLRFNDIDYGECVTGRVRVPRAADFVLLPPFAQRVANDPPSVVAVHCYSGISRSSAVAQALADKWGLPLDVWHERKYYANLRVYTLACKALDVPRTKADMELRYAWRLAYSSWHSTY